MTACHTDSGADAAASARYWVVEWSGGGGFGHYAWLLSDALTDCYPDVVLATRRTHELISMAHRHRLAPIWPAAPATRSRALRKPIVSVGRLVGWVRLLWLVFRRRGRGDIIHLQGADRLAELPFFLALRASGATIVATAHNALRHDSGRFSRAAARMLYRIPHCIVTHTDAAADVIRRTTRGRRPVLVAPHPSYLPMVDHFVHARHPSAGLPLTVAHLGQIRPYKGLGRVTAAVRTAIEHHPDLCFTIAGRAQDLDGVEEMLIGVPSANVVRDLGYLPIGQLIEHACAADVVVLGHRSTSESGVAHLALAAGAVVVGPRVPAIERLLASEPRWLYEPDDPSDAGRVLLAVLARVASDRTGMRSRARAVAEAVPSWVSLACVTRDFVESHRVTR